MEPDFLSEWRNGAFSPTDALDGFDGLPPIAIADLFGQWRGHELRTGHVLDGLLEASGWYGKAFEDCETVSPLLFGKPGSLVQVDPGKLPLRRLKDYPNLAHTRAAARLFQKSLPFMATTRPTARLRMIEHRNVVSAAMIYDAQPIIDHFRRIDDKRVLGLMEARYFEKPYFFLLERTED